MSATDDKQDVEYWLGELLAVIHCDGGHYQAEHGIVKASADAITKRNEMVTKINKLETDLRSALAANRKARKVLAGSDVPLHVETVKALDSVDLSALDKYVTEKTQPLVDALEYYAANSYPIRQVAIDTLAKE